MKVKNSILVISVIFIVGFMISGCTYYSTGTTSYYWPVRPFIYPYTEVTVSNNMENTYVDIDSSVGKRANLGPGDFHKLIFPGSTGRRIEYSLTITIKRQGKAPKSFTERINVSGRGNDVESFEVTNGRIRRG